MADALWPVWGVIFVVSIVVLLDWLGRRKERRSKH
jgi:hypothetical protein